MYERTPTRGGKRLWKQGRPILGMRLGLPRTSLGTRLGLLLTRRRDALGQPRTSLGTRPLAAPHTKAGLGSGGLARVMLALS